MKRIKRTVHALPLLGRLAETITKSVSSVSFPGSQEYWEERYARGGDSGEGSYGLVAGFKAKFLNDFVDENKINSVIEFGCGDGNQLQMAKFNRYTGLDVSRTAIRLCKERFQGDSTKSFFLYDPECFVDHAGIFRSDLALSLDVIFHLIEDPVFETYMQHLFAAAARYVAIYSSDFDHIQPAVHVRNRCFTRWVSDHVTGWRLAKHVPNPYPYDEQKKTGSWSDFYIYENNSGV